MKNNFFSQHSFELKYKILGIYPKILITKEALDDMYLLVDECEKEVGWLGVVDKIDYNFIIRKIYLTEQEVTASTTDLDIDGQAKLVTELINQGKLEEANKIRFWGHSHVNMDTFLSGVDDDQFKYYCSNSGYEFFIAGVLNKKGKIKFYLRLESGILMEDVPWEIFAPVSDANRERIKEQIKSKVREKVYTPPVNSKWNDGYKKTGFERKNGHSSYCICKDCIDENIKKWNEDKDKKTQGNFRFLNDQHDEQFRHCY